MYVREAFKNKIVKHMRRSSRGSKKVWEVQQGHFPKTISPNAQKVFLRIYFNLTFYFNMGLTKRKTLKSLRIA